jgi:hypothetical protein
MIKFFKKLKWLIKNQEKIEALLNKPEPKKEKNYSLAGVPEYQLDYINDVLEVEKVN